MWWYYTQIISIFLAKIILIITSVSVFCPAVTVAVLEYRITGEVVMTNEYVIHAEHTYSVLKITAYVASQ